MEQSKKIILVGTGELSNDIRFFIERYNLFEVVGYAVNKEYLKETEYKGLPVYPLESLEEYVDKNTIYTFVAIYWFHYLNRERRKAFELLKDKGFKVANLISPKAEVLTENIGEGNWICDYVYLDFKSKIGSNNIFRNYSYFGHYAEVDNHTFLGARTVIGGHTHIGSQNFIGISCTIFNNLTIGDKCILGAGTVVKRSVPDYSVVKMPNDNVITKQYTEETIELKLVPGNVRKKLADDRREEK